MDRPRANGSNEPESPESPGSAAAVEVRNETGTNAFPYDDFFSGQPSGMTVENALLLDGYREELQDRCVTCGVDHPLVAETLTKLGLFHQHVAYDFPRALSLYTRALEILRASPPSNESLVNMAASLVDIGNVYQATRRIDEALSSYREAITLFQHAGASPFHPARRAAMASIALLTRDSASK